MEVEIRQIDNLKGKGLFAKKNFKPGDVLFEEDPLVSCQFSWNAAYDYKACDYCLKPLETAEENARRLTGNQNLQLPHLEFCSTEKTKITTCSLCGVAYCSTECKNTAYSTYHRILCLQTTERQLTHPLELLNEAWKHVHYPPETNTIMLIVRLLARILQAEDRDMAIQQTLEFCHRTTNEDAQLAHKLIGEKFASQLSLLHSLLLQAISGDAISQFLTPEGFQSLLALVGTNGQGVGTSSISRWVGNVTESDLGDKEALDVFIERLYEDLEAVSGSFLNNEGVGLYSVQSRANHSCRPNAEPSFLHNSHRMSLVAVRSLEEGEEVLISYLDECALQRSRHSRRKELMENYLFACKCFRCEEEVGEEDVTSDEDMSE